MKVLGIGEHFHSFVRKMRGYQQFLSGNANGNMKTNCKISLPLLIDLSLMSTAWFSLYPALRCGRVNGCL